MGLRRQDKSMIPFSFCVLDSIKHDNKVGIYSFGKIGSDLNKVSLISKALLKNYHICDSLDLRNSDLTSQSLEQIIQFNEDVNLETYKLSCNMLTVIPIRVFTKHLKNLILDQNRLGENGMVSISAPSPSNLRSINLSMNSISDKGLITFSKSLGNLQSLKQVYLNKNRFGDEGIICLSHHLPTSVDTLGINGNYVTDIGIFALLEVTNLTIKHLDIGGNLISNKILPKLANSLVSLNLEISNLSEDSLMKEFIQTLSNWLNLQNLKLNSNPLLGQETGNLLKECLKTHISLKSLDVTSTLIPLEIQWELGFIIYSLQSWKTRISIALWSVHFVRRLSSNPNCFIKRLFPKELLRVLCKEYL